MTSFKWRDTIGRAKVESVPAGVHCDLWLGPAQKREFTRNRFHYNWHWFWDYGNGDFGNQGIHEVDISRWIMGVKYPTKVTAIGGHYMFDNDQETSNTLNVAYEFNEGGYNKYETFLGKAAEPGPTSKEGGSNWVNFIDVVRSRDRSKQNNDIEEGAISCTLMHLGNISYRLGRSVKFDAATWTCKGYKEATAMFSRNYRKGFEVPKFA